jgi:hypothetical protein
MFLGLRFNRFAGKVDGDFLSSGFGANGKINRERGNEEARRYAGSSRSFSRYVVGMTTYLSGS